MTVIYKGYNMNSKLKSCPKCFWSKNCGLPYAQKECQSFTTREDLVKKGYLPNVKKIK